MPTGKSKITYNQSSCICNRAICQHRAHEEDLLNINPRHFFKYVFTHLHPTSNSIVFIEVWQALSNPNDIVDKFLAEFSQHFFTSNTSECIVAERVIQQFRKCDCRRTHRKGRTPAAVKLFRWARRYT